MKPQFAWSSPAKLSQPRSAAVSYGGLPPSLPVLLAETSVAALPRLALYILKLFTGDAIAEALHPESR